MIQNFLFLVFDLQQFMFIVNILIILYILLTIKGLFKLLF